MSPTEMLILTGVVIAVAVFGYIEVKVIKKHNEKLIADVQTHVTATSMAINNAVKDAHEKVKAVSAKVDKIATDVKNAVEGAQKSAAAAATEEKKPA